MLNCSGSWKLIVTDIGRGRLAVNRRARYDTATHGSPRPRAPDLGGGSRPRPDEDGGDRARRRRRGARAPSTARDRRDHRRGDGARGGGAARRPRPRGGAAPGHRLYRRRVCRRVPGNRILAAGHGGRAARGPGPQPCTTRPFPPRGRQRAPGPRTSGGHRGRSDANSARGRRPDRVPRRDEKTLGRPAHGRVPERRLPRGPVRELDRAGGAPRVGTGDGAALPARPPALAQWGDSRRADQLRAGGRAPRVLRVPGSGSSGRGRPHDRGLGWDSRRSGARGARAMTLAGRGAVVTGGSRGIGLAVARALAEAGAAVVVAARAPDRLQAVAAELGAAGRRAWAVACDVADPEGVRTLAREAESRLGHVDILVNNAGISHSAPVQKTTLEDWNRLLTVNATAPFLCTQAFLPGMLARGWGRVVNIASVAGLSGGKYIAAYSASKHAVVGFTHSVAAEVAGTGVTVNAICPGYVDTDMTRQSVSRIAAKTGMAPEAALRAALDTSGQRRLIPPEEVARAVLALCQDAARETNGEAVVITEAGSHR